MIFLKTFENFIFEKVIQFKKSKNNFIIVMGGPGAGKSTAISKYFALNNLKIFNVDFERERVAKKKNLDLKKPENNEKILKYTYGSNDKRNRTIKLLKSTLKNTNEKEINIVFDTTGTHINLMKEIINIAKDNNFEITLVLIDTDINVALKRNSKRERRLNDDVVKIYHKKISNAFSILSNLCSNVWIINDEKDEIKKIKKNNLE